MHIAIKAPTDAEDAKTKAVHGPTVNIQAVCDTDIKCTVYSPGDVVVDMSNYHQHLFCSE